MARPQPGLFIEETAQHFHVEWLVPPGVSASSITTSVRDAIAQARIGATTMRGPNTVWGFDPGLWAALTAGAIPDSVRPFKGVTGSGGTAPATQRSIWLWTHGNTYEKVWAAAYAANAALSGVAGVASELATYVAIDNRDPIGFIDGTENPPVDAALDLALFPDDSVGAGGSAVLVQKWIHDLSAFFALSVADQEAVIGRTRPDSVELEASAMPPTSHVSRNVIEDETGAERPIYRRNTPFASIGETGTLFIGCTNDPDRLNVMLDRMLGATDDGLTDHLTRFSRAVSGSYYFVPSMDSLTAVFGNLEPGDASASAPADQGTPSMREGTSASLGIGSLRDPV